jgi:hypothetical protein
MRSRKGRGEQVKGTETHIPSTTFKLGRFRKRNSGYRGMVRHSGLPASLSSRRRPSATSPNRPPLSTRALLDRSSTFRFDKLQSGSMSCLQSRKIIVNGYMEVRL